MNKESPRCKAGGFMWLTLRPSDVPIRTSATPRCVSQFPITGALLERGGTCVLSGRSFLVT